MTAIVSIEGIVGGGVLVTHVDGTQYKIEAVEIDDALKTDTPEKVEGDVKASAEVSGVPLTVDLSNEKYPIWTLGNGS